MEPEKKLVAIILFALLAATLTIVYIDRASRDGQSDGKVEQKHGGYKVVEIDGCHYIQVNYGFGHSEVYSLTHKGDCPNPIHQYRTEK